MESVGVELADACPPRCDSAAHRRVEDMIDHASNAVGPPWVADLAGCADLSVARCVRAFRTRTGTTPQRYLVRPRMSARFPCCASLPSPSSRDREAGCSTTGALRCDLPYGHGRDLWYGAGSSCRSACHCSTTGLPVFLFRRVLPTGNFPHHRRFFCHTACAERSCHPVDRVPVGRGRWNG